ncbi:MAG: hypothetical protein FD138_1132 [Planctomycetota bacterium]|nr:MAG: hypothetical protein FD138_1132 [Planctomycetota bacterium]
MDTSEPFVNGWPVVLLILIVCGGCVVERHPRCRAIGKKLAVWTFLLSFLYFVFAPNSGDAPSPNLISAGIASLILAGMVLGVSWLVLPPLSFVYDSTLGGVFRSLKRLASASRERRQERRRIRQWERDRPERERESANRLNAQKRRDDAKAACDALFALAAPEIGTRFSKQDYIEFVSKYMADTAPPEVVEERAEQLKAIIRQHQERVEPSRSQKSLQELSAWFEERLGEIQSVPDERLRKTLIVQLKARYSDLTSTMLAEMSP